MKTSLEDQYTAIIQSEIALHEEYARENNSYLRADYSKRIEALLDAAQTIRELECLVDYLKEG